MNSFARRSTDDAAFAAVVEAAQLARRCEGYWQDRQAQAEGWQVHYAVDVDVITLYSEPQRAAQYARVFSALDDQPATRRLAELLGHYALRRLVGEGSTTDAPGALLIVPPHDDEYDRLRLAVMERAASEVGRAGEDLPKLISAITAGTGATGGQAPDLTELAERLVEDFGHVVEAFDGLSGAGRELARLSLLSRRLVNLYRAAAFRRERREQRLLPWVEGPDAPDRENYFRCVGEWRRRLERHRPRRKTDHALARDAMALATIQMVNQRAEAERVRLVLITGSENMVAACAEVSVRIEGRGTTFDLAYLRHPQAFIGAKAFFEPMGMPADAPRRARLRIVDWLNLFFPQVLVQARIAGELDPQVRSHDAEVRVDHRRLQAIIDRDDHWLNATLGTLARENYRRLTHREFPEGLLADFSTQIELIAADLGVRPEAQQLTGFRVQRLIDEINLKLQTGHTVEQLQHELAERIEQTVFKLYLETGELGVMQLIAGGDPVRGVPALRFEGRDGSYRAAQVQSEQLCANLWRESEHRFDLGAAYEALDADGDGEHYHAHLIHAQVYAARGHWFAARTLSRLAQRVAERIPEEERRGRRGREAAYLVAVAERRLAQTVADLHRARHALARARELEDPDRHDQDDPRFAAEAMAQEVAQLQFERFLLPGQQPASYPVGRLLAGAHAVLDGLRPDLDPVSVRSWVRRQVTTNVLVVALLARVDGIDAPDPAQVQAVLRLADAFRGNHLAPDSEPDETGTVYQDALSSFVYDVAIAVFLPAHPRATAARLRLQRDASMGHGAPPFEPLRKRLFLGHLGLG